MTISQDNSKIFLLLLVSVVYVAKQNQTLLTVICFSSKQHCLTSMKKANNVATEHNLKASQQNVITVLRNKYISVPRQAEGV